MIRLFLLARNSHWLKNLQFNLINIQLYIICSENQECQLNFPFTVLAKSRPTP
ncbi:hypothetical protein QWZ13_07620 [Reinekea marina]|uniref:hypothetical protein n=1 Tax=Reinekea marina TaxID=1310421 RepID=UPI0025B523E0|nr:hypothetical protein [Reinekea marina]MDN3648778.1 hypothetical protein [Reinekea marina]